MTPSPIRSRSVSFCSIPQPAWTVSGDGHAGAASATPTVTHDRGGASSDG